MEEFPKPLVEAFTPTKRDKRDLIKDFLCFIKEVNELEVSYRARDVILY